MQDKLSLSQAEALLKRYPNVYRKFQGFDLQYRSEILYFLMGEQSIKITYDPFFKHIFDPYRCRERVEAFISDILGKKVTIKEILQHEGKRLSGSSSLVIMDIVAQLEDGSYIDVEIQKIGYAFPGERTCCYSSDLILRQYDRLQGVHGRNFSYSQMMPVQVIVIMEDSADAFKEVAPHYLHRKETCYSSGAKVAELSQTLYISLDTFRKVVQNKIDTPLHAWLTLLSTTDIAVIMELIEKYPDFLTIYREIEEFRKKPEELVHMFSEALSIMDHNTELYMIEEMRKKSEAMRKETKEMQKKTEEMRKEAEEAHKEAEKARKEAEEVRKEAEEARKEAEEVRKETEEMRKETEEVRKKAEEAHMETELANKRIAELEKELKALKEKAEN